MARIGIGSYSGTRAPYSVASRLVPRAFDHERTRAGAWHARVPTLTELGRMTAVIVALIALVALVAVAPQTVLFPLSVALIAGLVASGLAALVGRPPRVANARVLASDEAVQRPTAHSR